MSAHTIRVNLMIPQPLMAQLRAHAELHGTGSPEISGELILAAAMALEPAIMDKVKRRAEAIKLADAEWRKAWPDISDRDELPL